MGTHPIFESDFDCLTEILEKKNGVWKIQSHVVRGKVGNEAAALPLELLGLRVDRLNTVQFSNHTGHGTWSGRALETAEVAELLSGLRRKEWLSSYHSILTGYMRDEGIIQLVSDLVKETGARWVCDPVMGDYPRGLYVPKELIHAHASISMKSATVVTPNQFEAEQITGMPITSTDTAWACIDQLHSMGPGQVVITSTKLVENGHILGFLSDSSSGTRGVIHIPLLTDERLVTSVNPLGMVEFTGTGDMFAACLCGHSITMPFHEAVGCALVAIRKTLEITLATIPKNKNEITKQDIELNQVAARREIMDSGGADWSRFVTIS